MRLMIRAIVSLIVRAVVVAAALAALAALAVSGDYHRRLQLTLGVAAGMLLVFAATHRGVPVDGPGDRGNGRG
jgi:hypothetical protein